LVLLNGIRSGWKQKPGIVGNEWRFEGEVLSDWQIGYSSQALASDAGIRLANRLVYALSQAR
jgi:hypothetical protein